MSTFVKKLGENFLSSVPTSPGIYRIYDLHSQLIYVGKAKNLRRRLAQYKNPKRRKKHRKMKKIIEHAARVEVEVCASELDAELLETQVIQTHRPRWNVAGAFYFLYPMIGIKWVNQVMYFCYTTQPESFEGFSFHGAFRSRDISGEAFFSLMQLLRYVGHPVPKAKCLQIPLPKYSYLYGFRQLPEAWMNDWEAFWKGQSQDALETLVLALVDHAGARKNKLGIQECLNDLARFWKHEAKSLLQARQSINHLSYPVSQKDRDLIFLKYRHSLKVNKLDVIEANRQHRQVQDERSERHS